MTLAPCAGTRLLRPPLRSIGARSDAVMRVCQRRPILDRPPAAS